MKLSVLQPEKRYRSSERLLEMGTRVSRRLVTVSPKEIQQGRMRTGGEDSAEET